MLYIQLHIAYDFVSIEEIMGLSHMNIISIFLGLELRNERLTALKRIEAQINEKKQKESNNLETFYHEAIPMENSGPLFHHKNPGISSDNFGNNGLLQLNPDESGSVISFNSSVNTTNHDSSAQRCVLIRFRLVEVCQ